MTATARTSPMSAHTHAHAAGLGALALAAAALLLASGLSTADAATRASTYKQPKIRHVFVIMLENEDYATTFGEPASDPYLAQTLPAQGALLEDYYATGHESNDNYIAIVSGQPPNIENQADCLLSATSSGQPRCPTGWRPARAACIRPRCRTSAPRSPRRG